MKENNMSKKVTRVTCSSLDDFGRGIVYIDDKTVFVENLLPGEEADVATYYEYGRLKDSKIEKRYKESKDRVKPSCPYYSLCGGCQIMHLSYEKQLEYKTKKVKDLLHKFACLDIEVLPTIGLDNPTRFRNKVQKPVRRDSKNPNRVVCGFYQKGTHDLVPIKDCLVETELSNKISNVLIKLIIKYDYRPYNEDEVKGSIRHILIKTSSDSKALVTIVTYTKNLPNIEKFSEELMKICPEVIGVVLNINKEQTNVILGNYDVPILGKDHISDKIFDNTFLISPQSFYQTNTRQIETLYGKAIEFADLKETDTVLDAYCGTGTIGLCFAKKVHGLTGVEINKDAVKDAIKNALLNGIHNAHFERDDATKFMMRTNQKFDVIIMDPPRKGSTLEFINACKKIKPRTIVYVSCDPVTLARDISLFMPDYQVKKVQPVDMFPHTTHVETIVLLQRKMERN